MLHHGFLRVAAVSPRLKLADCQFNAAATIEMLQLAQTEHVQVCVFPELGITGYTCNDLFHQHVLIEGALSALQQVQEATESIYDGVAIVGLPVVVDGRLFNAAAVLSRGQILGIVPKSFLPTYKEFYDSRYFAPASAAVSREVELLGDLVPFGTDLLFSARDYPNVVIGVEICEDLWTPAPPSSLQAIAGATVLVNLTASNETIGKASYRKQLVVGQSGRCLAAYVYAASGPGESTTDIVFGGHSLIAENGTLLAEAKRFNREGQIIISDVDIERLVHERINTNSFHGGGEGHHTRTFQRIEFQLRETAQSIKLQRTIDPHPFVPSDSTTLKERCEEIFQIQVTGLARRLEQIGKPVVSIGISGGLDSTLALLVVCKTFDAIGAPRSRILGITMPGYGTTDRTKANADKLMRFLGISSKEIDIRQMCFDQMKSLGHAPFGIKLEGHSAETLSQELLHLAADNRKDLVFENTQARVRTSLLMNAGFVIGTGDLSELALGWCTYNADHMSMYNPNVSIPKTLVKFLVRWAAENEFTGEVSDVLIDVFNTGISPELLPTLKDGQPGQSTEGTIGPYELHDFYLYHFLRYGTQPDKILYLASQCKFDTDYAPDVIKKWLKVFVSRFFNNQFKRSCLPDGPKVGSVSLSPRGDWRMPSDAVASLWLESLEG